MADRAIIEAEPRTVLGKQVNRLRREGVLPANVFGRGVDSTAVSIDARTFSRTIKTAGLRHMYELKVAGEAAPRYVIIRGLSRKGGTGDPIHVDFLQVDPERPITANVPLRVIGEAPAVKDLAGTLQQFVDVINIRCKPLAIPEAIEADASTLKSFTATLTIGQVVPPPGIEILSDPSLVVASVAPPRVKAARG
ncbi:MAG: 50S ribosomal protein L25 [Dehalococcoidia bacterium]|nr:50S ribosomal protein L25 [Dehalococcoidia bacterium]